MNRRVLLIDDDTDFIALIRRLLENSGYDFIAAESMDDGLAILQTTTVHAVILDLNLSKQSCFRFLELRQTLPELTKLPVIMLTASSQSDLVQYAISLGVTDFVIKPFNAKVLISKLKSRVKTNFICTKIFDSDDPLALGSASITGTVTSVSESRLFFEAPVRIALDKTVGFHCKLFDPSLKPSVNFKSSPNVPSMVTKSTYLNQIALYGLTLEQSKMVRSKLNNTDRSSS
jgi:response regulator RpfG family c-di-GMP phosphodiesterase